jgi:hydroxymethylpyrimidine pyrophosphatase-like HAD family hydrolase
MTPTVLATDLDGTLIPLQDNPRNVRDLRVLDEQLRQAAMQLIFVTGRHLASVSTVMAQAQLPVPDWIIADVGTSIYQRVPSPAEQPGSATVPAYTLCASYADELGGIIGQFTVGQLMQALAPIDSLRLQEAEKQTPFKLSYYVDHQHLLAAKQQIQRCLDDAAAPYSMVSSVDPFSGDGLIDLLPRDVTKAYGIQWWAAQQGIKRQQILYAGDSGNDAAVFAAGFRSIVVGNAAEDVRHAAAQAHAQAGWSDLLYTSQLPATSGVLAGLRHFLLT